MCDSAVRFATFGQVVENNVELKHVESEKYHPVVGPRLNVVKLLCHNFVRRAVHFVFSKDGRPTSGSQTLADSFTQVMSGRLLLLFRHGMVTFVVDDARQTVEEAASVIPNALVAPISRRQKVESERLSVVDVEAYLHFFLLTIVKPKKVMSSFLLIAFGVLVIIAVASLVLGHGSSAKTKNACELVHEKCAQFVMSSAQDGSPAIQLMHASQAVAYADVLTTIASDENLRNVLGVNIYELKESARNAQRNAIARIRNAAPNLRIPTSALAVSAGYQQT